MATRKPAEWTDSDKATLCRLYRELGAELLAQRLGRSQHAVRTMASSLNLTRSSNTRKTTSQEGLRA